MIFMGGCGRRVNHVPRRARGPRHTQGGGGPPLPAFFRERALALSPRSTFKPLGGVEVERFFSEGGTPPNFPSPAVLRRCCPPSAEGVACCQSSHKPRGAAAVLPFFSARAGAAARCQCLRGWAQAVGHVTPLWMGGLHDFHGGCGRRVNHVPRRAGGLGTHNLSSPRRKIADTTP